MAEHEIHRQATGKVLLTFKAHSTTSREVHLMPFVVSLECMRIGVRAGLHAIHMHTAQDY